MRKDEIKSAGNQYEWFSSGRVRMRKGTIRSMLIYLIKGLYIHAY